MNLKYKKYTRTLCLGALIFTITACQAATDKPAMTDSEPVTTISLDTFDTFDTLDTLDATESQERLVLSENCFREVASDVYHLSEDEQDTLYQKITDSKILEKENMRLTGVSFNDYDKNGKTDMLVCLYEDTEDSYSYVDGCLYLFMNDESPYFIYDDSCCYSFGSIFGDFGEDIDGDGNTEIVFCVQGTGCGGAGDCQKFMVKYKDKAIERMELPTDYNEEDYNYDIGLSVDVEQDDENNVYRISCPYLNDTILMDIPEDNKGRGGGSNCRGYYLLAMTEYEGRQLLAGYEYLYAGAIVDGIGNAVFLFDWDENGRIYVCDWYIEDWNGKKYRSNGVCGYPLNDTSVTNLPEQAQAGAEAEAYEEFLTGKRTAAVAHNAYIDVACIGGFLNHDTAGEAFSIDDLTAKITDELTEARGSGKIGRMEYALIDCGGDGKKQLALRAYGLGIYSEDDDSSLTMVFDERDGSIVMTYAGDSWMRSEMELYDNGYVFGSGSGGAGTHYTWEGIIKADGIFYKSYDCHIETGQEMYGMSSPWDVWDASVSGEFPAEFCEYVIRGETIYSCYIWDDVTEEEKNIVMDYIKDNEARIGIRFLTSDEAWARVEKTRSALGVVDGMGAEENKIVWKTL